MSSYYESDNRFRLKIYYHLLLLHNPGCHSHSNIGYRGSEKQNYVPKWQSYSMTVWLYVWGFPTPQPWSVEWLGVRQILFSAALFTH